MNWVSQRGTNVNCRPRNYALKQKCYRRSPCWRFSFGFGQGVESAMPSSLHDAGQPQSIDPPKSLKAFLVDVGPVLSGPTTWRAVGDQSLSRLCACLRSFDTCCAKSTSRERIFRAQNAGQHCESATLHRSIVDALGDLPNKAQAKNCVNYKIYMKRP
jgi:hypothetical protein